MKLSYNNFLKGKNKDANAELIDSSSYIDSKNLISEFDGENGSLVPMKGVSKFTWNKNWRSSNINLISVFNVITVKEVPTEDKVIYFLKGFNDGIGPSPPDYIDEDFILMVDSAGTIEVIMGGSDLGFVKGYEYHIDWVVANDQQYIFWCDNGHTAPKYINVADAISDFTNVIKGGGSVNAIDLETFINVVKRPPVLPPVISYLTDETFQSNYVYGKFFKFKYRFRFKDGSVGAFSPESKIDTQSDGFIGGGSMFYISNKKSFLNTISVVISSVYGVESIDIASQETELSIWQYENITDLAGQYIFKNEKIYLPLGVTDLDTKYYDNVPITALSQTYIESLIAYAGYEDGRNNVVMESFSQINYSENDSRAIPILATVIGTDASFFVDLTVSNVDSIVPVGDYLLIDVFVTLLGTEIGIVTIQIKRAIAIAADFMDHVIEQIEIYGYFTGLPATGSYTINAFLDAGNGNKLRLDFKKDSVLITGVTWSTADDKMAFGSKKVQPPSLKSGESVDIGIVYYDQFDRQGAVNKLEGVSVLETWQQGLNEGGIGTAGLSLSIENLPPSWATHYQLVYSNGNIPSSFLDFKVIGISAADTPISGQRRIQISNPLITNEYAVTLFNINSILLYKYTFITTKTVYTFPLSNKEIDIVGVVLDAGALYVDVLEVDFIYLNSLVQDATLNGAIIQIKSTEKDFDFVSYEVGEVFNITGGFHEGNVQNQVAAIIPLGTITGPNINWLGVITGGLNRTRIDDATLFSYPVGTPLIMEVLASGKTFKGFIYDHLTADNVLIETENIVVGSSDYTFWISKGSGSVIKFGTTYLSQFIGMGVVPADVIDFFGFKLYGIGESYYPIPVEYEESLDENALKVPVIANNLGRIQIASRFFEQIFNFADIIGSQLLKTDTNFFGLTSFPNTSFPVKKLDTNYGQITALVTRDTDIVVFQETRCGRILVFKDIITTAEGNQSVTVSDNVFGQYVPYMGDIGIGKRFESLQYFKGRVYFSDRVSRAVYRLSTDGLTEISDYKMKNYFNKISLINTFSAFDPNRDEYLIQTENNNIEVFSTLQNHWCPSIEISPEKMSRFNSGVVSFDGVYVFIHEKTSNYNELFNASGDLVTVLPSVEIASNDKKTLTKIYETLEITGKGLDLIQIKNISTKDAVSENITAVIILESSWIAQFKNGAYTDTLGSEFIGVGKPSVINGNQVLFDFDINENAIAIGDDLVYFDGANVIFDGNIIEVEQRTIGISGLIDGGLTDLFMVRKNASVAGSDLRGLFLKLKLEIPSNGLFFRLNAIALMGEISDLHEG